MFTERSLSGELATVQERQDPAPLVVDCEQDFETLDPAVAEDLLLVTESVDPLSFPAEWVPEDAPGALQTFASSDFTIGMAGNGGVAWTRQTEPPVVFVKPRLAGSPDDFVEFLIAEALLEVGLDVPEQFLGFFGERYPEFAAAVDPHLDPVGTYQLATATFDAFVGLYSREQFVGWEADLPGLFDAWVDAGQRLEPRLSDLSEEVAMGQTSFPAAAELACSAIKHGVDVPAPFAVLDTDAYRQHGPEYAITWAEKTLSELA